MASLALELKTELARGLRQGRWTPWMFVLIGLGAVAFDLYYFARRPGMFVSRAHDPWRIGMGILVLVLFLVLARGNMKAIGLRVRPSPSPRYWLVVVGILAVLSVALLVALGIYHWVSGVPLRSQFHSQASIWWFLKAGCLMAPFSEELIYRLALCIPLVILSGPRTAIIVSCGLFSYLHMRYGNFELNHVAAGAVLAWAYVRSGCLWLPIVLHALGNLQVLLVNAGVYYYQTA